MIVAGYYDLPSGARLSVRPSIPRFSLFSVDNLSIFHGISLIVAYILLSGMSGMGLLIGEIHQSLTE